MTDAISALPSPILPIRHDSDHDGAPETKSIAFNEIWQDKEKGLTFGDVLDIINPLQHIPVVSTIYRMVTGDEIGMGARLAGGALFGGPLGIAAAGIVAGLEEISGGTVEQHIASLFEGDDPAAPPDVVTTAATAAIAPDTSVPQLAAAVPPAPAIPTLTTAQAALLANLAPAAGRPAAGAPASVSPTPVSQAPALPVVAKGISDAALAPATAGAEQSGRTDRAGETASARVAREIAAAQRAQAGLLLASLQAEGAAKQLTASGDKTGQEAEGVAVAPLPTAPMPFRSHPYMLPPGAPSSLVASTMERALQRYHQGLQRQTAPTPAMVPAATPSAAPAP